MPSPLLGSLLLPTKPKWLTCALCNVCLKARAAYRHLRRVHNITTLPLDSPTQIGNQSPPADEHGLSQGTNNDITSPPRSHGRMDVSPQNLSPEMASEQLLEDSDNSQGMQCECHLASCTAPWAPVGSVKYYKHHLDCDVCPGYVYVASGIGFW
jgi:hypothetical protein